MQWLSIKEGSVALARFLPRGSQIYVRRASFDEVKGLDYIGKIPSASKQVIGPPLKRILML